MSIHSPPSLSTLENSMMISAFGTCLALAAPLGAFGTG
jgi:hypothetical protein